MLHKLFFLIVGLLAGTTLAFAAPKPTQPNSYTYSVKIRDASRTKEIWLKSKEISLTEKNSGKISKENINFTITPVNFEGKNILFEYRATEQRNGKVAIIGEGNVKVQLGNKVNLLQGNVTSGQLLDVTINTLNTSANPAYYDKSLFMQKSHKLQKI